MNSYPHQSEPQKTGAFAKSVFQTLYFAYRPDRFWLGLLLVFGLLGRLLILGNSNVIGLWVDQLIHPERASDLFRDWTSTNFIQILVLLNLCGLLLSLCFRVGLSVLSAKAVSQIYDETTWRASRFPISFFDQNPTGRIVTRFSSDYGSVFRLFGGPLAEFLSIIFDLVCMVILVTIASPFYLPVVLFIAGLNYVVYRLNQSKLREERRAYSASRSPSIAHFSETTQGSVTIRSFNREKTFADRFAKLDSQYLHNKGRVQLRVFRYSLQMNSLTALLLLLTGILAMALVRNGQISLGSIGVAFGFIMLSGNTVQMFFEWLTQFEEALIGLERMDQYLRLPLEPLAVLPSKAQFPTDHPKPNHVRPPGVAPRPTAISVKFSNVSFKYGAQLPFVLKDISLTIEAGEKVGIIGHTGSGKSSLIQVLMHLYPIEKGKVLLQNQTASEMGLDSFRSWIGFIPQDPVLFQTTVRENLDPGQKYTDQKLIETLHQVGLKLSLAMKIEEKGKNLSLGEKQLLCLTRCLLDERPLVVMDEATSSVDPRSEEVMSQAIEVHLKNKTQLIIAHRLSTLKACDRLIWLHNGEIRAQGRAHLILENYLSFANQALS